MVITPSVLLRMRNVSENICREHQDTHFWWMISSEIMLCMRQFEKYSRTGQSTSEYIAHAHGLLVT